MTVFIQACDTVRNVFHACDDILDALVKVGYDFLEVTIRNTLLFYAEHINVACVRASVDILFE